MFLFRTRFVQCVFFPMLIVCASAETPSPAGAWQRVQALPPQTRVHIKTDHRKLNCVLSSVSDDQLVCSNTVVGRAEIKVITLPRKGASTIAGLAIGAGAGAGIGVGIGAAVNAGDKGNLLHVSGGKAAGVGAAVGAIIGAGAGALVGYGTDFLGKTVYKR